MGRGSLAATGIPTEIADTIIATIIYFTATNVILSNFWNERFKRSFEKKEEALSLALEKEGKADVDISQLNKEERDRLIKEGMTLLKEKRAKEKRKEA